MVERVMVSQPDATPPKAPGPRPSPALPSIFPVLQKEFYLYTQGLRESSQGLGPRLWLALPSKLLGFRRSYVILIYGDLRESVAGSGLHTMQWLWVFCFLFFSFVFLSFQMVVTSVAELCFSQEENWTLWHKRPCCWLWSCNTPLSSWLEACSLIRRWA